MKWLNRSLVDAPYSFGLCQSEKSFRREMKRLRVPRKSWPSPWIPDGKDGTVHYFRQPQEKRLCCVVCIGSTKGRKRSEVEGLLIHEAVHVWQVCQKALNERKPSAEFEAYSIQNIAQRLIEAWR